MKHVPSGIMAMTFLVGTMIVPPLLAEGYYVDPQKYKAAKDAVVEDFCRKFEEFQVHVDPGRLQYGEHEIVDSFLRGRDFYRCENNYRVPVEEKLEWLSQLFGADYPRLEQAWREKVQQNQSGRDPLTKGEIEARLNMLRDAEPAPVKIDGGLCRSSSGTRSIGLECIHCGKRTIYRTVDAIYYREPPMYYRHIADELRKWGLPIEIDGRAACPDCRPTSCDFKLAEVPDRIVIREDAVFTKENCEMPGILKPGMNLKVLKADRDRFLVQYPGPECWAYETNGWLMLSSTPEGEPDRFLLRNECVKFPNPRKTMVIPGKGTVEKLVDFPGWGFIKTNLVSEIQYCRSSGLYDIPESILTVNGHRFFAQQHLAEALLAFVQGYDTVMVSHSGFSDHFPLKTYEPWLREILLTPGDTNTPPQRVRFR